ncbi:MAG: hypothetical protein EOP53_08130 [Sphingobacteriales bacterium]|nr:MAG: hypothetical protein EOP53_08130 [Sphingobacteriales bacterium]
MKILNLIAILSLMCSCQENNNSFRMDTRENQKLISGDSGFIKKADGLNLLISYKLTDTTNSFWRQIKDNDTIGKFYKIKETGNYYLCLLDVSSKNNWATHLILELNKNNEIIKTERFTHSNYHCCWKNDYEGFNKYGEYFGLKIFGTGSGYCATYLFLFKELLPQKSQMGNKRQYQVYRFRP